MAAPGPDRSDNDLPSRAGALTRLHGALGHLAIGLAVRLKRPVSLGVKLLVTNPAGEVLLVRHSYRPGLMLPGGGVEPGETCAEAALREAREEAGIAVLAPPRLFHVYLNRALANRDHVVLFLAETRDPPAPPRGMEILSAAFFAPDALPADVTPATRARIAEALQGAPVPDIW